jgi:CheY-like chemotaxis protein
MPDSAAEIKRSVLIVDRSAETREVLRTALARRGVEIFEAAGAEAGLELCRRHRPEVVVLDLDSAAGRDDDVRAEFESQAVSNSASLVLLRTVYRLDAPHETGRSGLPSRASRPAGGADSQDRATRSVPTTISKPYHYAPLVRTIEELLGAAEK